MKVEDAIPKVDYSLGGNASRTGLRPNSGLNFGGIPTALSSSISNSESNITEDYFDSFLSTPEGQEWERNGGKLGYGFAGAPNTSQSSTRSGLPPASRKMSPRLGWAEVSDFFSSGINSFGTAFAETFTELPNFPGAISQFLQHPIDTLERGGLAVQDRARGSAIAARDGDFRQAGALQGEFIGSSAGGTVLGGGIGLAIGTNLFVSRVTSQYTGIRVA